MRKRDELTKVPSCTTTAYDDEMVFVLLARDPAAPLAIRAWVAERLRLGKNIDTDAQIVEALECARTMDAERDAVRARVAAERTTPWPGCVHPRLTDTLPARCVGCGEIVGRPK